MLLAVTSELQRQLLLLLQRSMPRAIRVLLNKASSVTAYTVLMFLQDGTCRDDFVVTIGNKGTCFIDHAPKLVLPRPVRVSQADSMPLDSDSAALMRLT
jgi:hypothetical protein